MSNTLPSFALIATYSPQGDNTLPSTAQAAAVPSPAPANVPVYIVWVSSNIVQVVISGDNGVDPAFNSGPISTTGSGFYEIPNGFSTHISIMFQAYDTPTHIAITQTLSLAIT
jgi:hypothetical protein